MPLNIEAPEIELPNGMSQEVFETKQRVIQTMRELAREHRWCSVAEDGLRQAGVLDADIVVPDNEVIRAVANVSVDFQLRIDVSRATVAGKDPETVLEEVKQKIEEQLRYTLRALPVSNLGLTMRQQRNLRNAGNHDISGVTVTDVNEWVAPPPPPSVASGIAESYNIPDNWELGFTSLDGRVAHAVRRDSNAFQNPHVNAGCGKSSGYTSWVRDSNRSENRVCPTCVTRVGITRR